MPYTADKPPLPQTPDQLRARIPGWGADLDPADRPSVPREVRGLDTGAHWELPEQQEEHVPRERSVEHTRLTPVFGTSVPLKGLSGAVRRLSYARFSEGRAAHWLLLLAADRVDAVESHLTALVRLHPDDPVTETGIRAELSAGPLSSRRGRVDVRHQVLDPVVVVGPWVVAGVIGYRAVRSVVRRARREA